MRHLAPLVLLLLLAAPELRAQEAASIGGRVVAAETGRPLGGAAVTARRETDTVTVARGTSGADGRFRLGGLPAGRYVVRALLSGRQPAASAPVSVAAGVAADAGELRLGLAVVLEGIEVRAERPPVVHAEDRNIYNVADLPSATAAAVDVMRTLPELEVDLDGNVTLVGNRAATIHINGRPSPLKGEALTEFIRNLPADRIERIEVVPNPSVRFEGGNAAIVNIVLKKGVQLGLSGSLSANAATRGGNGLSGQLAYQRGRLTLFGGGSGRLYSFDDEMRELRENLFATPVTFLDQETANEGSSSFASADLTAEVDVGAKETAWGSVSLYRGGHGMDGRSHNRFLDADRAPTRIYDRLTDSDHSSLSSDLALGFRRIMEPQKHELALEVRHSRNGNDSEGRFEENTSLRLEETDDPLSELRVTDSDQSERSLMAKGDYQRPLGGTGRLEVGFRLNREDTDDETLLRVFAPMESPGPRESSREAYTYRESEHAAYVNLSRKFGPVSLQGGLRAERSSIHLASGEEGEAVERDYFTVFPSANLNYQFGEGRDVRLTYSKRVRRPWLWFLNPFVPQTDPLNLRFGNPDLEPSETHSLGLDVSVRASSGLTLRLSPFFRRTTDEIEFIRTVDSAGVATSIPRNIATVESYGSTLNASLRPTEWSNLSATVGLTRMERDASNLSGAYSGGGTHSFFSANATVQAGRGWGFQGSMRLSSPRETAQGRYSSTVFSEVGLKKDLFGDRSSLNVRLADPFNLFESTFVSRDRSFNTTGRARGSWGGRSASVSFTYRFGTTPKRRSSEGEGGGEGGPPAGGGGPPGG